MAKLIAEEGDLKGLVLSLEEGESWIIGRDPTLCQLIVEDPLTSRKHLIARKTEGGISLENLSSTNPTQVNEEVVSGTRLLQQGDTVKIGNETFRFYNDSNSHLIDEKSINSQNGSHVSEDLNINENFLNKENEKNTQEDPQDKPEEEDLITTNIQENLAEEEPKEIIEDSSKAPPHSPSSDHEEPEESLEELLKNKEIDSEMNKKNTDNQLETSELDLMEDERPSTHPSSTEEESSLLEDSPLAEELLAADEIKEDTPSQNLHFESSDEDDIANHNKSNTNENESNPNQESAEAMATTETKIYPEIEDDDEDTIFEVPHEHLAQINFGLKETGRWLLKVIGGPNNGAEFYMATGQSYLLGTDPHTCDIVFHDTSVSRQHAKISVTDEDILWIEDLKSRNGVIINNEKITEKQILSPSTIVTMGTTSLVIYDREGEMQTIISPLLPSIVKVLQEEEIKKEEQIENKETQPSPLSEPSLALPPASKPFTHWGPIILLSIIIGLFSLVGLATYSLFKSEPVVKQIDVNANEMVEHVLSPFPAVKYSFNKNTRSLLLLGHVATLSDKNQLMYQLQSLNFINSIDDSGLIIDEYVWREINSILTRNTAWQGISIHSPAAGEFILSGYLKTRKQAEQLSDYLSVNFPYLDLLKNQVIVEEDVENQVNVWLTQDNLRNVEVKISNGEINLTGNAPADKTNEVGKIVQKIKEIPGVRVVNNFVKSQAPEMGIVNISNQYEVTGQSRIGNKFTVVINGRVVSEGDVIDGMTIKQITANTIFLQQGETKYRIDYNK